MSTVPTSRFPDSSDPGVSRENDAQRLARFGSWELDLVNLDDIHANPLHWSDEVFRIFGYKPGEIEVSSETFFRAVHPEDCQNIKDTVTEAIRESKSYEIDHRILWPDGSIRFVHEAAEVFKDSLSGRPLKLMGIVQDITERIASELRLKRLNRLYAVLSKINEAIVRTRDEKALCAKACQIAVEYGQMKLAWVGEVDPNTKVIVPRVSAGDDDGYLAILKLSSEEGPMGDGPAGRAIREGKPRVSHDISSDLDVVWREAAMQRGFRSIAVFPLNLGNDRQGLMAFYSTEPHFFNQEQMDLLASLSNNIAFALDSIRKEQFRLAAEDALRKSEEYYRLLFFENPHSMWVYDLETLKFLAVNSTAQMLYGYTETEFLSMTAQDIRPIEERPVFDEMLRSLSERRNNLISRHCKKNGERMDVEISSDALTFNGRPARLVVATNVTEKKLFEQKLAEQAALIDQARDAIILRDMQYKILFWNKGAERLYGWTSAEALNQDSTKLFYGSLEKFTTATQGVLGKGAWSGELEHVTKAGNSVIVESRWTLVRDDAGRPKAVLSINSDITERKKMESHFLRAQRMESIGTLAGGIAHDLNNLLAPIIMGVDLLKHFGVAGPSLKVVEDIERSAKRGSCLVKQVLSFARGVEGARVAMLVKDVLGEVEAIIQNTFPKNITLETKNSCDTLLIEGDPTQINQVLLNLCVNSRDAMPNGGRISLVVDIITIDEQYEIMQQRGIAAGRYVCIEVTDTGSGIPEENIHKIFDPFFTTKELTKGTGLGLATTMGIIRSHGGFLNVYSEIGRGTTFKIYLPAQAEGIKAERQKTEPDDWPRGNGEWILLVDDEPSILTVTRQILEAFGYHVLTAEHGAQALALFVANRDKVALVLTDMMMPIMDGPTTIVALHEIDPALKIIGASGLNSNGNLAKAAQIGVKHFLAKPYTTSTLLSTLKTVLEED